MGSLRLRLIVSGLVLAAAATAYYEQWPPFAAPLNLLVYVPSFLRSSPTEANPPARPVSVKIAPVRAEDVPIFLQGIGTVQAYNAVSVQSRVDGEITKILFQEGQNVKLGDPLAIIDPRPLQAQLDQQIATLQKDQALLDGAVLDLQRYETLVKTMGVSRQQVDQQRALVDQYKAQVKNDEAQIDYARTQLGFTTIRAPLSGRVGIRQIDQGNFVRAISPTVIVVITQLQPISIIFTVSAAALGQTHLTPGQTSSPVAALDQDNTTELDRGTVDLVDNQVDQTTGTIKLKATFPNLAMKLWPGNFVNGRITLDTRRDGLTVPTIAVRHGPQGDFVWVARPDQTAAYRSVTVGQAYGGRSLINRGLTKGEQVVVEGYFRLETGSKIEIERDTPPTAPKQQSTQPSSSERG
jgi:membrane fusion protein, multidrug efflux system